MFRNGSAAAALAGGRLGGSTVEMLDGADRSLQHRR
jgi:hypothetical protein